VSGPYPLGSDSHFVNGYMTLVPSEWQPLFGGPALTGMCCLSITSLQSNGPSVSGFDPNTIGQVTLVQATRLLGYPLPFPLRPEASTNAYYNLTTKISGVVFAPGTRGVLFFGRHGTGPYCYGPGTSDSTLAGQPAPGGVDRWCYDPADNSKGTHAYPYQYQVWAYDANDLLAVKNGTKQQYAVQPYAIWNFNLPFENAGSSHLIGGAAYDSQTTNIYISQECEDINCNPVIHVFKVTPGTIASSPPLPAPANLRAQ
jgi:hypothetical protein